MSSRSLINLTLQLLANCLGISGTTHSSPDRMVKGCLSVKGYFTYSQQFTKKYNVKFIKMVNKTFIYSLYIYIYMRVVQRDLKDDSIVEIIT